MSDIETALPEPRTWKNYLMNIAHSLRGQEPFDNKNEEHTTAAASILGAGLFTAIVFFILGFLNSYGAARLSWCYNTFYGASPAVSFGWSFLCFFFSGLYYPVYALFLDPVCGRTIQKGGKR